MKFVTNTISTKSKPKTLSEIFKAAQTQAALTKTAAVKQPEVKVASAPAPVAPAKTVAVKQVEVRVAEEKEKDEAESSGQLESSKNPQNDPNKDHKKEAGEGGKGGKGGASDEGESSGQLKVEPLHQKGESTQEKPGDLETQKEGDEKVAKNEVKVKTAFKKVAEMTPEEKNFLRNVWRNFWPQKFIDALLSPQS